jgi:hypothetical protein
MSTSARRPEAKERLPSIIFYSSGLEDGKIFNDQILGQMGVQIKH